VSKVRELLEDKGTEVWSVAPTDSVYDALALMAEKNIGAVVVMDQGRMSGILSERDFTREVVLEGRDASDTQVGSIMSSPPVCVGLDQTVEECMALMTDKRVRHLPVLEDNQLVGLVSIGDVVKATIAEQKFTIEQLERYITS